MNSKEQSRFNDLYKRHLRTLKLQGKSKKTIDGYSRAVRRIAQYFDCCPDKLTTEQLEQYFSDLIDSRSWSMVKIDRNGLRIFWEHVLKRDWEWIQMIKPPKIQSLPDVLTLSEIENIIGSMRKLRFRVFVSTTYSMGLRLGETLSLQVGDIDAQRKRVHIRRGKGYKDRILPLPDITLRALRALWLKHRNPIWLFPNTKGSIKTIGAATSHMHNNSAQLAMKAVVEECGIKKKYRATPCATALLPTYSKRA